MADPTLPFIIYGNTPYPGAIVRILNTRTNEEKSVMTNSGGDYIFDTANYVNGPVDNDGLVITLEIPSLNNFMELYVSIDNGLTWQYVVDQVTYETTFNKTRGIVNQDQFPGGRIDNNISVSD